MRVLKKHKIEVAVVVITIIILLSIVYDPVVKNSIFHVRKTQAIWDIHFENLSKPQIYGAAFVKTNPELSSTNIGDYEVSLVKPGDAVVYEFDIVNKGNINAKIVYVNTPKLCNVDYRYSSCDWNGNGYDDEEDVEIINDNIAYTLMYKDTKEIVKVDDILNKNERKRVVLTLQYNPGASSLPKNDILLNDLLRIIQYEQK